MPSLFAATLLSTGILSSSYTCHFFSFFLSNILLFSLSFFINLFHTLAIVFPHFFSPSPSFPLLYIATPPNSFLLLYFCLGKGSPPHEYQSNLAYQVLLRLNTSSGFRLGKMTQFIYLNKLCLLIPMLFPIFRVDHILKYLNCYT